MCVCVCGRKYITDTYVHHIQSQPLFEIALKDRGEMKFYVIDKHDVALETIESRARRVQLRVIVETRVIINFTPLSAPLID